VASPLVESFQSELPCREPIAALLAGLARANVPRLVGSIEDSDEDLVLRLRDPRVFGEFVESVEDDVRVPASTRSALIEHVFDLLPLPRTEGEVIAVETRAPRHLLSFAAALVAADELSVLHVMHLVYAVFLDRSLLLQVPQDVRSSVLRAILVGRAIGEPLKVLYAAIHLSSVRASEAAEELGRILAESSVPMSERRSLATLAAAEDGGQVQLTQMAQREGLIPENLDDPQGPSILASIPRLPEALRSASLRFLERSDG
jgi:hypothetical protein